MTEIALKRYTADDKPAWDAFVAHAKNGHFLFLRDYMEYHADRFADHSLIALVDGKPLALLPANARDHVLYSHQGLTFGGWITDASMKTATMLQLFDLLGRHARSEGIRSVVYKCIPHLYHQAPAEEDMYALFRHGARLGECNVTTAIDYRHPLPFSSRRKRGRGKAEKLSIAVRQSADLAAFYALLEKRLKEKHGATPTHSLPELSMLARRFPDHIRLFAAYLGADMVAGTIIYETPTLAHAQYIASNEDGQQHGALDALFEHLIHEVYAHKRYFDFGTSNDDHGRILNEGLIGQKEEFGARAVAHCIYHMDYRE